MTGGKVNGSITCDRFEMQGGTVINTTGEGSVGISVDNSESNQWRTD